MTRLISYDAYSPFAARGEIREFDQIVAAVATIGVTLERWDASVALPAAAKDEDVLAAYADDIRQLQARDGYQSYDVIRLTPDDPARAKSREKYLSEHVHDDHEVRYCVEGAGQFYIRSGDTVYALEVVAGDLIQVPAGLLHWFDGGENPSFTALRLFTTPDGWAARFTGDRLPLNIPLYEGPSAD